MKILNTTITRDGEPYLVGEIGSNHMGDVKKALQMMSTLKAVSYTHLTLPTILLV